MVKLFHEVFVPQLGINDEEAILVEWSVAKWDFVEQGDTIAALESSKASFELPTDERGYIVPLIEAGTKFSLRKPVAIVCPDRNEKHIELYLQEKDESTKREPASDALLVPEGVKLTKKAKATAIRLGVDLADLPRDKIITETYLIEHVEKGPGRPKPSHRAGASRKVVVFGAGNGGLTVLETLNSMGGWEVAAFLDEKPELSGTQHGGLPVWLFEDLSMLKDRGIHYFVTAVADRVRRLEIASEMERACFEPLNAVHRFAYISPSAVLGTGNHIKAGAVIDANCRIGNHCIIDNGAIVPHDNVIGDGCHLAPGAVLGSGITIGKGTLVGIGSTIITGITIGKGVIVGAGANVVRDIPDGVIVRGNPAKVVGASRKS